MPAAYFSNFPFTGYSLNQNPKSGEYEWVTDVFRRVAPITNLLRERRFFHQYHIADGDTPEIIAERQYGSTKYFWVVALFNNITDPILEWPRTYANMVTYIADKYGSVATALSTIHHYTMTVDKVDSTGESSSTVLTIDETKYNDLASVVPEVYTFAGGATVTVTRTRGSVNCYDYEMDYNDSKRDIILLKSVYLSQVQSELETLLSAVPR